MLNIFLASSSEAADIASNIKTILDEHRELKTDLWKWDIFKPGDYPLDNLIEAARRADFGVFVCTSDDVLRVRKREVRTVRDNVLFEAGLFFGVLGRTRCAILVPKDHRPKLPSDLEGLNVIEFEQPTEDRVGNALGSACMKVIRQAKQKHSSTRDYAFRHLAERGRLTDTYIELTRRSKTIDIVALTLTCFADNYPPSEMVEWMTGKDAKRIRILVLDPRSCAALLRGRQESVDLAPKTLNALTSLKFNFLSELKRRKKRITGRFEVRLYDDIPYMGYFKGDNTVIYGFNYMNLVGQQSDCLLLSGADANSQFYKNLCSAFENLWSTAEQSAVFVASAAKCETYLERIKRPFPKLCQVRPPSTAVSNRRK